MKKIESLKHGYHFRRAYKRGNFAVTRNLVVYVHKNNLDTNRLGVTIKKAIGKSVLRNRLKRLIKENYRFLEPDLKKGYDFVIVVRKNEKISTFVDIKKSMKYMFKKLNILKRDE